MHRYWNTEEIWQSVCFPLTLLKPPPELLSLCNQVAGCNMSTSSKNSPLRQASFLFVLFPQLRASRESSLFLFLVFWGVFLEDTFVPGAPSFSHPFLLPHNISSVNQYWGKKFVEEIYMSSVSDCYYLS